MAIILTLSESIMLQIFKLLGTEGLADCFKPDVAFSESKICSFENYLLQEDT